MAIRSVLLVPGLFEPPLALYPLRNALAKAFPRVTVWRDRWVFRNLDRSVQRIADAISSDAIAGEGAKDMAIVTHSFGDWVVRQAIARCTHHRVAALVSIAPAMRAGFLSRLGYLISWKLTPELTVINDRHRVAECLDCDSDLQRLVLWARFDESLRQVALPPSLHTQTECVTATHLTIVLQADVQRRTVKFIRSVESPTATR